MSVWLTPDLKPFFGGTYFPPASRWGRPGFVDILHADRARLGAGATRSRCRSSAEAIIARLQAAGDAPIVGDAVPPADTLGLRRGAVPPGVRRAPRRLRRCAEVSAPRRAVLPPAGARPDGRRAAARAWRSRRCTPWPSAACATTSAAASTATRSTRTGACRTSRRCSTTRRSSFCLSRGGADDRRRLLRRRSPRTRCSTSGAT